MEKGKKIILFLSVFFRWLFYINLVAGLSVVLLQIINLVHHKFNFSISYLGKFQLAWQQVFSAPHHKWLLENMEGIPELFTSGQMQKWWVFVFTLVLVFVIIAYNHLALNLFSYLSKSVKEQTPFTEDVIIYLKKITVLSFTIFVVGSLLSLAKVLFFPVLKVDNAILNPVYDNGLLSFLWIGIAFYLIKEIYNVGVQLKKEQDLTI